MMRRILLLAAAAGLLAPAPLFGQFTVEDLVLTTGASAEGYKGNLPSVGVPVQDSTESASALIGEVSVQGQASYRRLGGGTFRFGVDGGLRQFATHGFELGRYSPREWVGTVDAAYSWTIGENLGLLFRGRLRGRQVEDRPPMPIFLQPGYHSEEVSGAVTYRGPGDVIYDAAIVVAQSAFLAPQFAPQIRLLDQDRISVEGGATITNGGAASLRLFGAVEASRYPRQTTFTTEDPFRRDQSFLAGASFSYQNDYVVQLRAEGRANRSNSNRPEYDALTVSGLFSTSLPHRLALSAYGALSMKNYLHESEFARLLPGEEANNASLAYLSLSRAVNSNLDGTFRVGWTRAETEIGDAYFRRFGGSILFRYRP